MTNTEKQLKNSKRGGYTPTIAKDANKHKVQKLKKYVDQLRKEMELSIDEMYKQALYNVIEVLKEILK